MKTTENSLDAPDKPPTFLVLTIIVVTFLLVFVAWFLVYPILGQFTYKMQTEVETGMANKTRLSYIQQQEEYLKSSGPNKISIDQAMDEVIQKANK